MKYIRNFSIIAHIDHGKSTLSDRIIQICGGLSDREMENQVLDSMDLERERGITIKAQSVNLKYKSKKNNIIYKLNLIDTPGHVDFSYEVSRSLTACEGALLVIDATQGIEAQTLANCYISMEMNLKIIPVINKIDLPYADPHRVAKEIENILGIDAKNAIHCSSKTGVGVIDVLECLIQEIPHPTGDPKSSLQALIIDSWFDNYLGVISLIRINNGILRKGEKIKVMSSGLTYNIEHLGIFTPKRYEIDLLSCGEVGWVSCGMKKISGAIVGDTITLEKDPAQTSLQGFNKITPQVYASIFTVNQEDYGTFRESLDKLSLNDASLFYEKEVSTALGLGFRCGFLGILHMEIIKERLEREYNLNLITTIPHVIYEIETNDNTIIYVDNPSKFPLKSNIKEIREPIAECNILLPKEYIGNIIKLCEVKRGIQINIIYYRNNYVLLIYEIPMMEVIIDFFDNLKSYSKGYASLEYKFKYFKRSDIIKIDIIVNGEKVDALSLISHSINSRYNGSIIVDKLKELIPRQQFDIVIQAAIGNQIIARSTIKQLRKNVIAKCYGGDITRKKKLLEKQKIGKKRMKRIGNIDIPKEAFLAILKK